MTQLSEPQNGQSQAICTSVRESFGEVMDFGSRRRSECHTPSRPKRYNSNTVSDVSLFPFGAEKERRRRDSNPRYGFRPYNGLANRRLQPLGHVSKAPNG